MWRLAGSAYLLRTQTAYSGRRSPQFTVPNDLGSGSVSFAFLVARFLTTGIGIAVASGSLIQSPRLKDLWRPESHTDTSILRSESKVPRYKVQASQSIPPEWSGTPLATVPEEKNAVGSITMPARKLTAAALDSRSRNATSQPKAMTERRGLPKPTQRLSVSETSYLSSSRASSINSNLSLNALGAVVDFSVSPARPLEANSRLTTELVTPTVQPLTGYEMAQVTAVEAVSLGRPEPPTPDLRNEISMARRTLPTLDTIEPDTPVYRRESPETIRSGPLPAETEDTRSVDKLPEAYRRVKSAGRSAQTGRSIQTARGVEFAVQTKINRDSAGTLTLLLVDTELGRPQYLADNISILLSDLITLFGPRMQPEVVNRFSSSSTAQQYVTLNDLRSQGIAVSFDDADRLVFKVK